MELTEPKVETPRRKRRWFQFSLRTVLLVMLLASIGMSWFAVKLREAKRQEEAVDAITKAGGSVGYDYEFSPSGNRVTGGGPRGPAWLRPVLGEDFLAAVVAAQVNSDAELEHLRAFTQLRELNLYGPITDAGLEHLEGLTQLRKLYLYEIKITDAGLKHVEELTQLEELYLNGTRITDAGLESLRGITQLRTLVLDDTQITDAGLEHLHGLTRLERLFLVNVRVTDEGVKKLQQALPNCKIER